MNKQELLEKSSLDIIHRVKRAINLFQILDETFTEIWTRNIRKKAKTWMGRGYADEFTTYFLADAQIHGKYQYRITEEAFRDSKTEWTQLVNSIGGEFTKPERQQDPRVFSIDPCSVVQKNSGEVKHTFWIAMEKETALKIATLGYFPH
jgi:hypothetical protein